jgi:Holliday junction resolvasome RuvABC ATP-dependent DNA helicase subunit
MKLSRLDIDSTLRSSLEALVLDALFEYTARKLLRSGKPLGAEPIHLSLTQALDILASQSERWKQQLSHFTAPLRLSPAGTQKHSARLLMSLLTEAHHYYQHQGTTACRTVASLPAGADPAEGFALLWGDFFSQRVWDWLKEHDLLRPDEATIERADTLVENAKTWVQHLSQALRQPCPSPEQLPLQILDTVNDLSATFERGPVRLILRGQPQPLLLLQEAQPGDQAIMCAPAQSDDVELRLAQLMLHTLMLEHTRKRPIPRASLLLFPLVDTAEAEPPRMPLRIRHAFDGFIGNTATVRRLQRTATAVIKDTPPRLKQPLLFHGATGTGKAELVRRLARALDIPLIHIPGRDIHTAEHIHQAVLKALEDAQQPLLPQAAEHGQPEMTYPPLLLFLDDIQALGPALEAVPKLISSQRILQLPGLTVHADHISVVAALTSSARLPDEIFHTFQRVEMQPYTPEEIAHFVKPVFDKAHLQPQPGFLTALARAARCNPRLAVQHAHAYTQALHAGAVTWSTAAMLDYLWKNTGLDEHGLSATDYAYLQALESGSKALPALQQLLHGQTAEQLRYDIEPRLLEHGTIRRHSKGRSLTVRGELLLLRYQNRQVYQG